jgi:amidase
MKTNRSPRLAPRVFAQRPMSRRSALVVLGAGALTTLGATSDAFVTPPLVAAGADLHWMGIQEIGRLIQSRKISPIDLTRRMLDRIQTTDAALQSYATVMTDQAMDAAAVAEREIAAGKYRGPLHGIPIAVKDLCFTRGVRTMAGTRVLSGFVPDEDAAVVAKIRAAGGVVLGKLNLTEGAMAGYNPDRGIPLNPWNAERWAGVSSSGSGVATAAGLCFAAIGTDTGGSIRFPSSANGIVGLKPTYGRVSRYGVFGLSEDLDHVGPMARSVTDVAIVFDAIAGHDPRDATSLAGPVAPALPQIRQRINGLRIGIDRDYALKGIDAGQAASLEEALKVLTHLGARIVDVKVPDLTGMVNMWLAICATQALAFHKANYPSRAGDYGPYFRQFLATGQPITPQQTAAAQAWRTEFTVRFTSMLESVDAMACPAGGAPAWPITHDLQLASFADYSAAWAQASPRAADFTMPMNLAGTPGICLPSGFSADGLPYSIQFAGKRLSEAALCRIAYAYEQATTWHTRHPKVVAS